MAGVLGDINQNLMGLQALAAGRQEIDANRRALEDRKIASDSLREYQRTAQEGNPNFEALSEAALRSPEMASNFLKSVGIADARRGQDAANYALSAYQNIDNPEEFVRLTQNRINYLQQQGRDPSESVRVLEKYMSGGKEEVRAGTKVLAASLANQGYLDKDIYASTFGAPSTGLTPYQEARLRLEERRLQQGAGGTANQKDWETYQRLLKEDPQAAEAFGRAAGFASKEGVSLSPYAEKQLDLASTDSAKSSADAARYETLADQISRANMGGGVVSSWREFVKEQTGNQDEITDLRKQALQVVNSEAIKNLPPGVATDRDIALAREPFPTDKADPKYVADWLRAISNLNKKRAEFSEFKADFISRHGSLRDRDGNSLIKAWKEQQKNLIPETRQGGSGQGANTPGIAPASATQGWSIRPLGQ